MRIAENKKVIYNNKIYEVIKNDVLLCKKCENEDKTIDDTGLCFACRVEEYEEDSCMCDFD